ncbi:PEP/pyruvate-binding domain-containing protein [Thermosulfuriphilus sp.]
MDWIRIWDEGLKRIKTFFGRTGRQPAYDPEFVRELIRSGGQLKRKYADFKRIVAENDQLLDIMAELSDRSSLALLDPDYLSYKIEQLLDHTLAFIEALNSLSGQKYLWLYDVFERINDQLSEALEVLRQEAPQRYVYFLDEIDLESSYEVGAKAASLAEARKALGLSTPYGFVVGTKGFKDFLDYNQLRSFIEERLSGLSLKESERVREAAKEIEEAILQAQLPDDLLAALEEGVSKVGASFWAVRSSALGEDGRESFAGQFLSRLNVPSREVPRAYLEVVASLYGERAIFYRLAKGLRVTEALMAVLVLEMIDARVSGVLYTLNPSRPTADEMLISSLWGLGKLAVGGDIHPDIFILDRASGRLKEKRISSKAKMAVLREGGGIKEIAVPEEQRNCSSLKEDDLSRLYQLALILEEHFHSPQDVEWCLDHKGWIYLLQTRPLEARAAVTLRPSVSKAPVFSGQVVSPGAASGPLYLLKGKIDLEDIPRGAILVVVNMDPELAKIVPRLGGLIALKGGPTTHLATILREFGVPAIVLSGVSLKEFKEGEIVTLDAIKGRIFSGRVEEILKAQKELLILQKAIQLSSIEGVRRVLELILPLSLGSIPEEGRLSPKEIKTVHDIVRFIHEVSVREMFGMSSEAPVSIAHILRSPRVPIVFYIIDIEGGLDPRAAFRKEISINDIRSLPFLALWRGMTHEGVSWTGAVEFDLGGFVSVVSRSFVKTKDLSGKAYALISREYLNFHSHLAYHFAVVDSFCSEKTLASNYVAFRFQGGGAGLEGRLRRVTILQEILNNLGFRVDTRGDRIMAVFRGGSLEETEEALDQLGRLMAYVRQMDMAATDEEAVKKYVRAFLEEDYSVVQR